VISETQIPEYRISASEAAAKKSPSVLSVFADGAPFISVVAQFALIVLLVSYWDLKGASVTNALQLAFVGFVIHHLLPARLRLPFFAALSIVATVVILGQINPGNIWGTFTGKYTIGDLGYRMVPGGVLVAIGLLLIGLCHIPVAWWARATLVSGAMIGLALVRANTSWLPDVPVMVWVILGSMFVFRLMVYLYDMKNRAAPFGPARALSYFFMLPNVCFPLFPLVDYKTFCSTYYNEDWKRIYQSGIQWMFRGVVQLLLYQAIYQFAPLDATRLSTALDATGFMLATYLLYLHVSGQFHLIVGLLHMFGFNLPETHHMFLLASSFTDFWRRINIYWKDFIMKLFFYPLFFSMRKKGTILAMSLATLATFFITWFLHSWQWFWIRGSFLLTWQDISFWTILAVLVLVNGLYEATAGRGRKLKESKVTLRERLILGLKAVGTFCVICTLWTIWSCHSAAELSVLADAFANAKLLDVAIIIGVLAGVAVAAMYLGRSSRETSEGKSLKNAQAPFYFWRSAMSVGGSAAVLLLLPFMAAKAFPETKAIVARLRHESLNARDLAQQRRGYYEELDAGRVDNRVGVRVDEPSGWNEGTKIMYRDTTNFLQREIVPSSAGILSGKAARANALGMRDREYDKTKPANTRRIVLLGSSHELGVGINEDEVFENLTEDRLNRERPETRWEILNMSVAGSSLLEKMLRLEQIGFGYQPDAVFFCANSWDWNLQIRHLKKALAQNVTAPPGYRELLDRIVNRAGVSATTPDIMFERRLRPHMGEIYQWVFARLAEQCRQRGIPPFVVYRPATFDVEGAEKTAQTELLPLARAAGLEIIDLTPAYDAVEDRGTLVLAQWDDHTSALGHKLLGEKLYEGTTAMVLPKLGQRTASK
jgi:hypothetical protein